MRTASAGVGCGTTDDSAEVSRRVAARPAVDPAVPEPEESAVDPAGSEPGESAVDPAGSEPEESAVDPAGSEPDESTAVLSTTGKADRSGSDADGSSEESARPGDAEP